MTDAIAVAAPLVAEFEGFRARPYLCPAGVWTIGYGTTRIAGAPVRQDTPPVSQVAAMALLAADLEGAARDVARVVRVPLTTNQRAALISFAYNVGGGALARSTLLRHLNTGRYAEAAEQFDVWNRSRGTVLPGLVRRRAREKALFLTPDGEPT